jgi:hypothetical protein
LKHGYRRQLTNAVIRANPNEGEVGFFAGWSRFDLAGTGNIEMRK